MKRSSSRVVNVWDLRRVAQKQIPRVVFDYLDGGAEGEVTLRENCHAFKSVLFRPRQAVAFAQIDLHTQVFGTGPFASLSLLGAAGMRALGQTSN
jgi:(S)-mandelate dehydrogenase